MLAEGVNDVPIRSERELNARRFELSGPGFSGTDVEGGLSRPVKPAAMVIVPLRTPHEIAEVTEAITYFCIRLDPRW